MPVTGVQTCALPISGGRAKDRATKQQLISASALALGISETKLKAHLASGKTISQIAPAGMTEDQFRAKLIAKLTPMLDTAITNKQLTAAEKAQILKRLQTDPVPYWNKPVSHKSVTPANPPKV